MDKAEYLKYAHEKFEVARDEVNKNANESLRELSKQLITIASVTLPLSLFVFSTQNLVLLLDELGVITLIFFWISMTVSIVYGLIHNFIEYKHASEWADVKHSIAEKIVKFNEQTTFDELTEIIALQDGLPIKSRKWSLCVQGTSLVIGLSALVLFLLRIVMKFPN